MNLKSCVHHSSYQDPKKENVQGQAKVMDVKHVLVFDNLLRNGHCLPMKGIFFCAGKWALGCPLEGGSGTGVSFTGKMEEHFTSIREHSSRMQRRNLSVRSL